MHRTLIDRKSPVPLYYQVAKVLKERIEKGQLLPGHRIQPEFDLVEEFGVSRHTIREALSMLENEGLVYRQPGLGTFVQSKKYSYPLSFLRGFTEQMEERGLVPSSQVISLERLMPDPFLRSTLALPEGSEVWDLRRLRLADSESVAFEIMILPVSIVPSLEKEDLAQISMYRYVEERVGCRIGGATQTIEAEIAPENVVRLLGVEGDALVLRMKNVTYLENGRPLCFVDCYYRADRYIFTVSVPRHS